MKKPEPQDFGLTKEDFDNYKYQQDKYAEKKREKQAAAEKSNRVLFWFSFLPLIIFFIIAFATDCQDEDVGAKIAWKIMWIAIGVLSACVFYFRLKRNPEDEGLGYRSQYIDQTLENRIESYNKAKEEYEKLEKLTQERYWRNMSGYSFEWAVASLYQQLGYEAKVTKASGDGGVDIVLKRNGQFVAVQCKHHSTPVGPNDFRALIGTVALNGFDKGIFVSLNGFTAGVFEEQRKSKIPVELVELSDLISYSIRLINQNIKYKKSKPVEKNEESSNLYAKYIGTIVKYKAFKMSKVWEVGRIIKATNENLVVRFVTKEGVTTDRVFLSSALNNSLIIVRKGENL